MALLCVKASKRMGILLNLFDMTNYVTHPSALEAPLLIYLSFHKSELANCTLIAFGLVISRFSKCLEDSGSKKNIVITKIELYGIHSFIT